MNIDISIKIIGSIMVIISGYGISTYYCNNIKRRIFELEKMKRLIYIFQGRIRYANDTLEEIINEIASNNDIFCNFFKYVAEKMRKLDGYSFESIWEEAIISKGERWMLSEEDKCELIKIGGVAGKMDKQMQYDNFMMYIQYSEEKIAELKSEYGEKSRMYKLLGISLSMALVIILI